MAPRKNNTQRPRRAKGGGTVYWDDQRQRYRGQAPTGQWVSGKSRTEAENKIKAIIEETAADGALGRSRRPNMKVDELFDKWIARVIDGLPNLKTRENYLWSIGHLRPQIGTIVLADLTVDAVDAALIQIARKVKAKSSLARIRKHLRAALRFAIVRDWVHRNVAEMAVLPAAAKAARRGIALTDEKFPGKVDELLAALPDRFATIFTVQLEQGLRPGETNGLTLEAVDVEAKTLSIFQQMSYDAKGVPIGLKPVKTGNESRGVRTLKMTPRVAELLRQLVEARQLEQQVYPEWPSAWRDLLFVSTNGTPYRPSNMQYALKTAAQKIGLADLRRYDLRHTACQRLLDQGVAIDQVADYMGHEDLRQVRGTYSHKSGRVLDPRPATPSESS